MMLLNLIKHSREQLSSGRGLVLLDLARAVDQVQWAAEKAQPVRVQESINPALFSLGGDSEDAKFRRITSPNTTRDLNPLMHERMQQVCYFLKVTTLFGKRIVELITSYVVGEGFEPTAEDENVKAVIDAFWEDPVNDMDRTIREWCDELSTFGELCVPVAVNPVNGFVRLGYIDPQKIEAVEYGQLMMGEFETGVSVPVAVRLRRELHEREARRLTIIHRDEDPNSATFGQLVGDCFYWAINKPKGASRGISELFNLADWIDVFDEMIFDFADRVRFLNAFVWDYTVKGADEKKVAEIRKDVTKHPPRQGGVQVHNDNVVVEAKTPDLKGGDMSTIAETLKKHLLGGAGFPAWFFADPVDANRATASEMSGPTGKKLTDRQRETRGMVLKVLGFVLNQAQAHGVLRQGIDLSCSLQVPDLMIKDLEKGATVMQTTANALAIAEDRGWIRPETAARGFHTVLTQIGVEVDSSEEFAAAQQQKQEREVRDIDALKSQRELAEALMRARSLPVAGGVQ